MTSLMLTAPEQLLFLPDDTLLTVPGTETSIRWQRAYNHAHRDARGMWTLPRNPFVEFGVTELEASVPVDHAVAIISALAPITGDEVWLSTLDDPHDTTR